MTIDPNNLAGTAHLTFDDEFNSLSLAKGGTGTWNTTHSYSPGGYQANTTWFVDANAQSTAGITPWTVQNGTLTITAEPHANLPGTADYSSGHLDTNGTFSQLYGYFEMRAKMPAEGTDAATNSGGEPGGGAFWLLPTSGAWPPELDVVESTNWGGVFTAHSGVGGHTAQSSWANIANVSSDYHTYGVDWEKDQITWYVDGHEVYQAATPSDMNNPMYMLLNLYTNNDGSSTPGHMDVDYVRAYADGAAAAGVTGTTTSTVPTSTTTDIVTTTPPTTTTTAPTSTGTTGGSTTTSTPTTTTASATDTGTTTDTVTDHGATTHLHTSGGHHHDHWM